MHLQTIPEAARTCGRSPREIRLMIEDGRLAAVRHGGRWLIDPLDLPGSAGLPAAGADPAPEPAEPDTDRVLSLEAELRGLRLSSTPPASASPSSRRRASAARCAGRASAARWRRCFARPPTPSGAPRAPACGLPPRVATFTRRPRSGAARTSPVYTGPAALTRSPTRGSGRGRRSPGHVDHADSRRGHSLAADQHEVGVAVAVGVHGLDVGHPAGSAAAARARRLPGSGPAGGAGRGCGVRARFRRCSRLRLVGPRSPENSSSKGM